MQTKKTILHNLAASLTPIYGQREALCISKLALEGAFSWSEIDYLLGGDKPTEVDQPKLDALLRELTLGKPVQYVLGEAHFAGHVFSVNPHVLIPRPETESLVRWIAEENQPCSVLDIGTGSGAIAITLAVDYNFKAKAIDISRDALATAQHNAAKLGAEVSFSCEDILNPSQALLSERFDVIVSNPPYIPEQEITQMHRNVVDFEPHTALFVPDNDPLLFYRQIALLSRGMLSAKGSLYFEIHSSFASQTVAMLTEMGYCNIELRKDINQKERMIRCQNH